jgi:predicted ATPase
MMILEKDLEEMIYSASQCDEGKAALARRGLIIRGKLYRQVSLGNYGRLDLVDVAIKDKALYVNIIELKAEKIGSETIAQVLRYKYAIKNWLKVHYKDTFQSIKIISTVIGSELKDDGI